MIQTLKIKSKLNGKGHSLNNLAHHKKLPHSNKISIKFCTNFIKNLSKLFTLLLILVLICVRISRPVQANTQEEKPTTTSLQALIEADSGVNNAEKPSIIRFPKKFLMTVDKGDDNSSLIVQINLGKLYILESAAFCYRNRDKILISLSQFNKAVEFPILINDDLSGASGWFIEEKRLFTLNFNSELLLVNGKRFAFSPDEIRVIDNDIYFEIGFLEKIFPLKLSFDPYEQIIEIISIDQLPVEKEIERNQRWKDLKIEQDTIEKKNDDSKISTIKSPYKVISSPVVDLRINKSFTNAQNDQPLNINGLAGGDLLFLNHQLFFNTNQSKINSARLTSGQKDSQGDLLGPLKATDFQIGDVAAPQNFLVSRGGQIGKGVSITNYPDEFVSGFDRTLVRGNMQAGWDVELYRNDQLLLFQKVSPDGIYEFENVPLVAGANIVKLVFYGPFGQKREEIKKYFVDENLLKSSKFYYRLSLSKNNETLFNQNNVTSIKDPKDGKNRYFAEFAYGLNKTTSLISDFIKIPIDRNGASRTYNSSSLRGSYFGIYTDFNIARQIETRTHAFQTSAQTKIFEQSLTLKNIRYDKKFISEQQQENPDPLFDSSTFRLDGPIGKENSRISNSLNITNNRYYSKESRLDIQNDISATITSKFSLGQNLRHISDSRITDQYSTTESGRTLFNYRISRPLTLRSAISYDLTPKASLTSASSAIDYNLDNSAILNLGHNYQFSQAGKSGATNYIVSLSKPFKKLLFSTSGSYNDDNKSYGINLNISMSIGYDLRHKTGLISSIPMANNGLISARVFVDTNNNGKFDGKDYGLKDVRVLIDGKPSQEKTDENGVLIIGQVPTSGPIKIKVGIEDIGDPALVVKKPIYKMIVHAGNITNIDFPVVSTGEISGMVSIKKSEKLEYASSVQLELIDEDGNLVKETVSAFDGYYVFDSVPLGTYKMRVSPAQIERLNMISDLLEKEIVIKKAEQEVKIDFSVLIRGTKEELTQEKTTQSTEEEKLPEKNSKISTEKNGQEDKKIAQILRTCSKSRCDEADGELFENRKRGVSGYTSSSGSTEKLARRSSQLEDFEQVLKKFSKKFKPKKAKIKTKKLNKKTAKNSFKKVAKKTKFAKKFSKKRR